MHIRNCVCVNPGKRAAPPASVEMGEVESGMQRKRGGVCVYVYSGRVSNPISMSTTLLRSQLITHNTRPFGLDTLGAPAIAPVSV